MSYFPAFPTFPALLDTDSTLFTKLALKHSRKMSEFLIFWLLVNVRKGIQLLKFLPLLLRYYCVDNAWGGEGTPPRTSQVLLVPPYIRKKALNPGRKTECTHARMMVLNMECKIYVGKVGWNIWDFEKTWRWYLLFAGSEAERTRG